MTVEIRKDGACWSLYVNGRPHIAQESFAVVDRVRDDLLAPDSTFPSETWEVAEAIRKGVSQ